MPTQKIFDQPFQRLNSSSLLVKRVKLLFTLSNGAADENFYEFAFSDFWRV